MKIAQVVCAYPPYKSGIGNTAKNFTIYLKNRGHEVTVFSPEQKDSEKEEENHGLKSILKFGHGGVYTSLYNSLDAFEVVILHYPFFGASEIIWLSKIIKKHKQKQKLIIYYHMDTHNLIGIKKILSLPSIFTRNKLFKIADLILCSSYDYIKTSQVSDIFYKQQNKFCELPFAVNTKKFVPKIRKKHNVVVGFVGGLDKAHYFKGVDVLMRAFSGLDLDNILLKIVGRGELINDYKLLAKDLDIERKIEFLDNINNDKLADAYNSFDIFVLPSINSHEAFGIVLLEAMSSGLPVVASRLPGVRSVFADSIQGFYCLPGDENDLKQKLETLVNNEELRLGMGEKARILVLEKYSEDVAEEKLNNILNQ